MRIATCWSFRLRGGNLLPGATGGEGGHRSLRPVVVRTCVCDAIVPHRTARTVIGGAWPCISHSDRALGPGTRTEHSDRALGPGTRTEHPGPGTRTGHSDRALGPGTRTGHS